MKQVRVEGMREDDGKANTGTGVSYWARRFQEPYGSDRTEATTNDGDGEVFKISIVGGSGGPDDDHDTVQ